VRTVDSLESSLITDAVSSLLKDLQRLPIRGMSGLDYPLTPSILHSPVPRFPLPIHICRMPPSPDTAPSHEEDFTSDNVDSATTPYSPALPGQVRNCEQGALSKLPPQSDVVDFFTKLINDNDISSEKALVKFITTYEVPI
jgi:hypothetical protein